MDSGIVWIVGIVCVAVALWLVLRPRGGGADPAAIQDALARGALIVDVRTPGEFDAGHVAGARNVPVATLASTADSLGDKAKPVLLYCRSGSRSAHAKRVLVAAGYTDVVDAGAMGNVRA
jgi:phage shock protein E